MYGNRAMHHLLPSPMCTCHDLCTLSRGLSAYIVKSKLRNNTNIY